MAMVFCRGCAKQLHETAITCPQCGATQVAPTALLHGNKESAWMAIASLVLGVVCVLSTFDDTEWSQDKMAGLGMLSIAGLVLGIISINEQKTGKGMAIAGTVLSVISLLIFIGLVFN